MAAIDRVPDMSHERCGQNGRSENPFYGFSLTDVIRGPTWPRAPAHELFNLSDRARCRAFARTSGSTLPRRGLPFPRKTCSWGACSMVPHAVRVEHRGLDPQHRNTPVVGFQSADSWPGLTGGAALLGSFTLPFVGEFSAMIGFPPKAPWPGNRRTTAKVPNTLRAHGHKPHAPPPS